MNASGTGFSNWDLEAPIAAAIEALGWTEPTEIQREALPPARQGMDVVGQARTGSGKTAAFGIPILESCSPSGADIIVGTPGRVIDMTKRGHLKLEDIEHFCLDEADRMLDMGFFPDVLWIFEKTPNREQTLLFSATFPQEVLDAAEEFMIDATHVMSDDMEVEIPEIDQYAIRVGRANKLWALGRIIAHMEGDDQMLVFANTKRMVEILSERLGKFRIRAIGLHGDLPQGKRERILDSFKGGGESIVVATDVAARGLDVDGITHVVNYDLPDDTESYVHRIGRTGRMGRNGEAWSFVTSEDRQLIEKI
ncbi:uncharacterized protein METZ01_LOCUS343050, partial [marine metagenome]